MQPVWDAQCVRCHDAGDKHGINLTGTLDADRVPASYRTLIAGAGSTTSTTVGLGATTRPSRSPSAPLKSQLWEVLDAGHYDVKLTRDEMHAHQVLDRPELPALARLPVPAESPHSECLSLIRHHT